MKLQNDYEELERKLTDAISQKSVKGKNENNGNVENSKDTLIFNKLKRDNNIKHFEDISERILNQTTIEKSNKMAIEFTNLGLIEVGNHYGSGQYYYRFTPEGRKVYDLLLIEKLK